MFRRLRLRLTLLYLLAAVLLTVLIDGGVYALLKYSFQVAADQALERKVELGSQNLGPAITSAAAPGIAGTDEEESEGESGIPIRTQPVAGEEGDEDRYDAELAPVFLVSLDAEGNPAQAGATVLAPLAPDEDALHSAANSGRDLRTLVSADGSRYRLLTIRVITPSGDVYLQAGRSLADQEVVLRRARIGMLMLSAVIIVLLGWGSWLLAGRSLVPAQDAWERQQAFVANASHELRTPLTLLRASAEVAQRRLDPSSPAGPLLGDVLREADHMAGLVEDLLLLSRLDAGSVRLEAQPVDVDDLLKEVAASIDRLAQDRRVRLELHAVPAIMGDRARLRQVVLILLDNALRHIPAGGWIRVSGRQEGKSVVITVADNGTGIEPEQLPHVFERFYSGGPRESAGSGLGLSIARPLVQAMQGEIHLESRPGEGTRVTVTLPGVAPTRPA